MKSIALYYSKPENDAEAVAQLFELHINLWKVQQQKYLLLKNHYYFDFGIMFPKKVNKLKMFLPFQIKDDKVEDLGKRLSENQNLLSAVFNEEMLPEAMADKCYTKVKSVQNPDKVNFHLYILSSHSKSEKGNNISVEQFANDSFKGCYVNIDIMDADSIGPDEQIYIRFRVEPDCCEEIFEHCRLSNDLLQAAFSDSNMFDIRVNEKRELNMKVVERMAKDNMIPCTFCKLHFFYMADIKEKVINGSSLKIDSRLLEQEHWSQYEPTCYKKESRFLAYHWKKRLKEDADENRNNDNEKKEKPFDHFTIFYRTIYPSVDFWRVSVYISILLLLNSFSSYLNISLSQLNPELKFSVKWILLFLVIIYILGQNFRVDWGSIRRK